MDFSLGRDFASPSDFDLTSRGSFIKIKPSVIAAYKTATMYVSAIS